MALRPYSQQGELWGPSPDLALPAGHPARAIYEIIERLGLEKFNRKYRHTAGEPAYDVRGMVKILVYAYARGITSSREMARQCEENLAFQFLTRGEGPDFRTISRFRRKRRHLLRWVFKKTVMLTRQMGMARLGLVALSSATIWPYCLSTCATSPNGEPQSATPGIGSFRKVPAGRTYCTLLRT